MPAAVELTEGLRALLSRKWGEAVEIREVERLSGGASRETWSLVAATASATRRLVLRRDPPGEPRPEVIVREAGALAVAARRGVPEPELVAWSSSPDELGAAYILMDHVPGETIARRVLRDPSYTRSRAGFAAQCGRILAAIHSLEPADITGLPADDPLDSLFSDYLDVEEPHPAFELAFRWLTEHRMAESGPMSVVHGDFRLGNLIIDTEGIAAVLDWELVHAGDPVEDLGWLCTRAWRFGGPRPVGGMGRYDELITAYEQAGGRRVSEHALRWWEVFASLRWGVICASQARRHLSGAQRSVELAAIGRRTCEQEHDLLALLDPSEIGRRSAVARKEA